MQGTVLEGVDSVVVQKCRPSSWRAALYPLFYVLHGFVHSLAEVIDDTECGDKGEAMKALLTLVLHVLLALLTWVLKPLLMCGPHQTWYAVECRSGSRSVARFVGKMEQNGGQGCQVVDWCWHCQSCVTLRVPFHQVLPSATAGDALALSASPLFTGEVRGACGGGCCESGNRVFEGYVASKEQAETAKERAIALRQCCVRIDTGGVRRQCCGPSPEAQLTTPPVLMSAICQSCSCRGHWEADFTYEQGAAVLGKSPCMCIHEVQKCLYTCDTPVRVLHTPLEPSKLGASAAEASVPKSLHDVEAPPVHTDAAPLLAQAPTPPDLVPIAELKATTSGSTVEQVVAVAMWYLHKIH